MNRPRTAMFTLSIAAICATLGTHTTPAQQFSSGAASSSISAGASAATNSNESNLRMSREIGKPNPLEQADRAHAESTRHLLADYHATTDADERKKLNEELEKVITEHFEIRQKIRAQELEELQAQVRRLQDLHDRREREKDQIIRDRLRQLLRDAEGLGWGSSDSVGTSNLGGTPFFPSSRSVTPANVPR